MRTDREKTENIKLKWLDILPEGLALEGAKLVIKAAEESQFKEGMSRLAYDTEILCRNSLLIHRKEITSLEASWVDRYMRLNLNMGIEKDS